MTTHKLKSRVKTVKPPKSQVQLRLKGFEVSEVHLTPNGNHLNPLHHRVDYEVQLPSDDEQLEFSIRFDVQISYKNHTITIVALARFQTGAPIDEEFRNSNFPRINAPAIAFPLVRAFVVTLTSNCGIEPIYLPSVNFTKYRRETPSNITNKE
jgi:preprotein translocase subunit SecB